MKSTLVTNSLVTKHLWGHLGVNKINKLKSVYWTHTCTPFINSLCIPRYRNLDIILVVNHYAHSNFILKKINHYKHKEL